MATTQDYLQKSTDGTAVSHLDDSIVYHDTTNSRIGISTSSPGDKLDVKGSVRVTNTADAYPGLQVMNYNHDNMALNFDAYYESGWKSSDSGSNFRIYKINDTLRFSYASGVNQGSTISAWASEDTNCAMSINTNDQVGIGVTNPNSTLQVEGSFGVKVVAISSFPATIGDQVITLVSPSTSNQEVSLPSAADCAGRVYCIKYGGYYNPGVAFKLCASGNDHVDGSDFVNISPRANFIETIWLVSDGGTNWLKIGQLMGA